MPSFTLQSPDLRQFGPVIDVELTIGSTLEAVLRSAGIPIPAPVRLVAMIDTGASKTVIQQGLASPLGLSSIGVSLVNTPSSADVVCQEFIVRLVFPDRVSIETVVIEAPLPGQTIQCLIGRDILAHAVFVYLGHANTFGLSF